MAVGSSERLGRSVDETFAVEFYCMRGNFSGWCGTRTEEGVSEYLKEVG